jgi:hypothetical protein
MEGLLDDEVERCGDSPLSPKIDDGLDRVASLF